MKQLLFALAVAAGLQLSFVPTAQALDMASLPAFQQKLYENGEPLKTKPLVLRDFIELRHARGFSKAELEDLNGKKYALNGFTDKLVMVDIWATWCEPCVRSLPAIKKLQERFNNDQSNVRIVSVSVDKKKSDVQAYLKQHGLEGFTTLMDPDQLVGDDAPLDVVPSVFILDGKGNLVGFVRGFIDWSDAKVPGFLEELAKKYAKRAG